MQTIKKVILVVICFFVLLTSLLSPVSAVDYYYDESGDVWLYDESEDVYYKEPYMEMAFPSVLTLSEPNYSFEPASLPWAEMPAYVQEIAYTPLPNFFGTDEYLKVPFLCVLRTNTYIRVVAGYNLCLGRIYSHVLDNGSYVSTRGMMYLFAFSNLGSSKYTVCYSADYNLDYSVKVPWHSVESTDYGSNGNIKRFAGLGLNTNGVFDLYGYGANYGKEGHVTSFTVYADNQTVNGVKQNYNSVTVVQNSNGFESGRFISYQNEFENAYFSSFTPKPLSQIEAETQKGIWDSIKELPSKITDGIKNLLDKMLNYILYFQETKPEHVNPFADILTDVKSFFNDQMSDVGDFKNSLSSTLNNVVTYIETGSGVVNTFFTAVPMLSAFITFFVVFCIVRKVIGR